MKIVTFSLIFAFPASPRTAFSSLFFQMPHSHYCYNRYQNQDQNRRNVHRQNACLKRVPPKHQKGLMYECMMS